MPSDTPRATQTLSTQTATSAFGRHGHIARTARAIWRTLPISIPMKEAIRRFILQRLADIYHLLDRHPGIGFHPADRHGTGHRHFTPRVTAVVPNYNHAPYLRQRLDSIYGQTYPHLRVLLLDDCSTDGSRDILCEYAERYPEITQLVFNQTNSGGVFRQWLKGIESADSDLVWIAESDDYCDTDFLARLVPYFTDEAVKLAYAHSVFVSETGATTRFTFEDYLGELSLDHWRRSFVTTAHEEVAHYLGRKNTIPNVSSALFRRFDLAPLLAATSWIDMRICGDWVFYLHAVRGGKIAYCAEVDNYYRFHGGNSSTKTYAHQSYYREHEEVACEIARLYRVPAQTLDVHRHVIRRFFEQNAGELAAQGVDFDTLYCAERVRAAGERRLPNLLIAAFAFASGGGEIFPIRLANALSERGYAVTFFDFRGEPMNPVVRGMLGSDIPVVELTNRFLETEDVIRAFGIEVVHTHHASVDHFFGIRSDRSCLSAPHVITMHGMYDDMSPTIFERTVADIYANVAAWIYISDKNLTPFRDRGYLQEENFLKIPNGMTPPRVRAVARDSLGIPDTAFVLCVASRAIPEKGWSESIQVVTDARRLSRRDIQLLLLGEGPAYDALGRQTLPDFVHLLGFVGQTVDYYASADAGMLLSTFSGESFPLTIIECLITGRPMIASDIGEIRDMLTDETGEVAGYLVDISGGKVPIADTARQVAELATNPELQARKGMLARAQSSRFGMDRVVEMYGEVYRRAIAGEWERSAPVSRWGRKTREKTGRRLPAEELSAGS